MAVLALILAIGAGVLWRQAARLNLLALGEEQAFQLGVEAEQVKRTVFVVASLITGAAISAAGSIGFVGLIVPHAARLLLGPDNRQLVPAAALEATGILDLAGRRMDELSGGERQLVSIARALAQEAPMLLLDEPTAHLDLRHRILRT